MHRRIAATVGLAAGLIALVAARTLTPTATTSRTSSQSVLGVNVDRIVLDNGFQVLVVRDDRVPRVAASLWYRFGGLQERNGEHGAAHFLEHSVHQGTTTVGVTNLKADRELQQKIIDTERELIAERNAQRNLLRERRVFFDELEWPVTEKMQELRRKLYALEEEQNKYRNFWEEYNWYRRAGAIYPHGDPVPATTGTEHLDIEVDLPKERLELFFRLEADRMANAVLRGFEAHRYVVLEQFMGRYNPPEPGRFGEALYGVTGISHPSMQDPAGHLRDFNTFDRTRMIEMYDNYFVPNNATLALVGAITPVEARALAEKYFGRIPSGTAPAEMDVEADPPPGGAVRLDWLEPADPRVVVRYRIPGTGHPDRPIFDVIARLIGGGGISAGTNRYGMTWPLGSPTIIDISARAQSDDALPALEQSILDAVERMRRGEIDANRLAQLKKQFRFEWSTVRSQRRELAAYLGRFANANDAGTIERYIATRDHATPAEIQRVAQTYLVPWNRVIGTTRRNPPPGAPGRYATNPTPTVRTTVGSNMAAPQPRSAIRDPRSPETLPGHMRPVLKHNWVHPRDLKLPAISFRAPDLAANTYTLPNGLRAIIMPDTFDAIVQVSAAMPLGRLRERRDEAGATAGIGGAISQVLQSSLPPNLLARTSVEQSNTALRVSVETMPEDWRTAFAALVKALRQPFTVATVNAIAPAGLGGRGGRGGGGGGGGGNRAVAELRRITVGATIVGDVAVRRGQDPVVDLATRSVTPGTVVLAMAGAITRADAEAAVRAAFADWPAQPGAPDPPAGEPPVQSAIPADPVSLVDEAGSQAYVALGHAMKVIDPADEPALAVLYEVFNIRLNIVTREMRGLTNRAMLDLPRTRFDAGMLVVRAASRPESVGPILQFSLDELLRIRTSAGAPTIDELEQAKGGIVLGAWQSSLDGPRESSATYALEIARWGSLNHLNAWPAAVRAVTAAQVTEAAQKYILPAQLSAAVTGSMAVIRDARHPRWPVSLEDLRTRLRGLR